MPIIFETENFVIAAHDQPHHDRNNGGHAKIYPKKRYGERYEMPLPLAAQLMHLTQLVGEAITNVMRAQGIPVVRINYQDNGNWSYKPGMQKEPHLHVHLYVRSENEKHPRGDSRFQTFPEALVFPPKDDGTGYYEAFQPYSDEDCQLILAEAVRLSASDKYGELEIEIL